MDVVAVYGLHEPYVLEISVVEIDEQGRSDEYDTLLEPVPRRDDGEPLGGAALREFLDKMFQEPQEHYGISRGMLDPAPTFEDVSADIAMRLNGRILVTYANPVSALVQEFQRCGAQGIGAGRGICLRKSTSNSMASAPKTMPVSKYKSYEPRTLVRARGIMDHFQKECLSKGLILPEKLSPFNVGYVPASPGVRTWRRDVADPPSMPLKRTMVHHYSHGGQALLEYEDLLDMYLADGVISKRDWDKLNAFVEQYAIPADAVEKAHQRYFDLLVAAAWRDGVITDAESGLIMKVGEQLEISDKYIEKALKIEQNE